VDAPGAVQSRATLAKDACPHQYLLLSAPLPHVQPPTPQKHMVKHFVIPSPNSPFNACLPSTCSALPPNNPGLVVVSVVYYKSRSKAKTSKQCVSSNPHRSPKCLLLHNHFHHHYCSRVLLDHETSPSTTNPQTPKNPSPSNTPNPPCPSASPSSPGAGQAPAPRNSNPTARPGIYALFNFSLAPSSPTSTPVATYYATRSPRRAGTGR
jgi:hypothetical protein